MKRICLLFAILFASILSFSGDEGEVCRDGGKIYDSEGQFLSSDFVAGGSGLEFDETIHPDFGGAIDLDNIVFPSDQPFYCDYIGEGAGASHVFGFFFLDIDTNKNGIPNFYETNDWDDMDGDGIRNSLDDDDDGDGIPDVDDTMANAGSFVKDDGTLEAHISVSHSMPAYLFRNGEEAAEAALHAGDFWQWVPSNAVLYKTKWVFAHPGAFLYVDDDQNAKPDILQAPTDINSSPCYIVEKDHGYHTDYVKYGDETFPGLLGNWNVAVAGTELQTYWLGSTIFKLADDDDEKVTIGFYNKYCPYNIRDISAARNAQPDYNIYGTSDTNSPLIPESVKGLDPEGKRYWRYRWYKSDISGGRELCFFLTVFYKDSTFIRPVNTYYSKSSFNPDPGKTSYVKNKPTKGDKYGDNGAPVGVQTPNNWFPKYRNGTHHNKVAQYAWGKNWGKIATKPTDGTFPVAKPGHEGKQDWIDKWQNYAPATVIINYIALQNWLDTAGGFEEKVFIRYGIDLDTETDNSLIRKVNGNMNHMMVGAPATEKEAWLLGWEDLFDGGDRDYEDVVFYVKREARGSAQSQNVAGALDRFDDVSISTVEFEFEDNFTEAKHGVEGNYVNYYYRLSSTDEWIALLGGEHLADPNIFTENTETGDTVYRHVVIQLADEGSRELYWKVEMNSNDVSVFEPEVSHASVDYKAMVHEVFYNGGVISNSNVDYYGAYETPSMNWKEKNMNRGHFYARKTFEHGDPLTVITIEGGNPEQTLESAPPAPWLWDAGYSMLGQVKENGSSERHIFTFVADEDEDYISEGHITEHEFAPGMDESVRLALQLDSTRVDGVIQDNFHDPGGDFNLEFASDWLAAWVHGYHGIVGGSSGYNRDWILGGLNRASPAVIRPPGIPFWIDGQAISSDIKKSYWDFMDDNKDIPTKVMIGSESGMVHLINAGHWIGKKLHAGDIWADGHFKDGDFGNGTEQWAMIPYNLLNDMKNNKNGGNSVAARIDNTSIITVIRTKKHWRRIAVISQGENGGSEDGNLGNYVWAMDISDINNEEDPDMPTVLWERTAPNYNQIIGQAALAWVEKDQNGDDIGGEGLWVTVYTSGAVSVPGQQGTIEIVRADDGDLVKRINLGVGVVMAGTPAMVDVDNDGYSDWLYGATSDGRIIGLSMHDFTTRCDLDLSSRGARFFLSPNVVISSATEVTLVTVTGDNPLLKDENLSLAQNAVVVLKHDTSDNTWETVATYELKAGHKAFARPLLAGNSLILATTTGDTFDYCDYDPDDPGSLYLFPDITDLTDFDVIENFGTAKAPLTGGGRLHVHYSMVSSAQDWNASGTPAGLKKAPTFKEPPKTVKASIFMPLGFEEMILGEDY